MEIFTSTQTMHMVNGQSFNDKRFTPSGCKDIGTLDNFSLWDVINSFNLFQL